MARAHEGDDDNPTTSAAREQRTQIVVEAYIALLARAAPGTVADPAAESFRLVDVIRGQSVQNALTASSARSRAKTPALAELVRKAQDLEKQHGAQLGLLNNVLSLPPAERDDRVVKALQLDVDKVRVWVYPLMNGRASRQASRACAPSYLNGSAPGSPSRNR
jgi:hypothetical protein